MKVVKIAVRIFVFFLIAVSVPSIADTFKPLGPAGILSSNAKEMYIATQAYLSENPDATVDCAVDRKLLREYGYRERGYKAWKGVTCSGKMSATSGSYIVSGSYKWGVTPATITHLGVLTTPVPKES